MPSIRSTLNLYASQQIPLSLRGMFYILVSKNILENLPTRYDYLSRFTAKAREERDLPIDCFIDGGRYITDIDDKYLTVDQYLQMGTSFIYNAKTNYKIPRWYNQPHYVEAWVEKSAMRGILNSIINTTGKREVRIVPTGGHESVTFAWDNVKRLRQKQLEGKQVHIRYFGDLDPPDEAIEREIYNKLWLPPYSLENFDFKRVGVTNEQKIEYHLIPNTDPKTINKLKKNTTRFAFMEKYGLKSEGELFQIEVDALQAIEPERFKNMVLTSVDEFFIQDIYDQIERPTEQEILQRAEFNVRDLLTSLQNELDESG